MHDGLTLLVRYCFYALINNEDYKPLHEGIEVICAHLLTPEPLVMNKSQPMALYNSFYRLIDPWNTVGNVWA